MSLYSRAQEQAITSQNVKSGWSKTGVYLFSPDRVLRDIQKPSAEVHVLKDGKVNIEPCLQVEMLQTSVTAEALTMLCSLIKQDAVMLDSPSKQHLQKFANATQKLFAECAILLDENLLLF